MEKLTELLDEYEVPYTGFLGKEIRTAVVRQGFQCVPVGDARLQVRPFVLAHMNYTSSPHVVAKYGVDTKQFDQNVMKLFSFSEESKASEKKLVVLVDEYGAMENFSQKFKDTFEECLKDERKIVICTVSQAPFLQVLASRNDTLITRIDIHTAIREDIGGILLNFVLDQMPDIYEDEAEEEWEHRQKLEEISIENAPTGGALPLLNQRLVGQSRGFGGTGAGGLTGLGTQQTQVSGSEGQTQAPVSAGQTQTPLNKQESESTEKSPQKATQQEHSQVQEGTTEIH